jgi:hypothetical protein
MEGRIMKPMNSLRLKSLTHHLKLGLLGLALSLCAANLIPNQALAQLTVIKGTADPNSYKDEGDFAVIPFYYDQYLVKNADGTAIARTTITRDMQALKHVVKGTTNPALTFSIVRQPVALKNVFLNDLKGGNPGSVTITPQGVWTYTPPTTDIPMDTAIMPYDSFMIAVTGGGVTKNYTVVIELNFQKRPTPKTWFYNPIGTGDGSANTVAGSSNDMNALLLKVMPGDTVRFSDSIPNKTVNFSHTFPGSTTGNLLTSKSPETLGYFAVNAFIRIARGGIEGAPITIDGNGVTLQRDPSLSDTDTKGWHQHMVKIVRGHVVVKNFKMVGALNKISLTKAEDIYNQIRNKNNPSLRGPYDLEQAQINAVPVIIIKSPLPGLPALTADTARDYYFHPRDISIDNNTVSDFTGAGITANGGDRLTFSNNIVLNNARRGTDGTSGLSIFNTQDTDANLNNPSDPYRIIIANNIVARNETEVKWTVVDNYSDGNGIIVDNNSKYTPGTLSSQQTYVTRGRTLVYNNVVYENGGAGIQSFFSQNVDIIHNTLFRNGIGTKVKAYPEIELNQTANINVYNNYVVAQTTLTSKTSPDKSDRSVLNFSGKNNNVIRGNYFSRGPVLFQQIAGELPTATSAEAEWYSYQILAVNAGKNFNNYCADTPDYLGTPDPFSRASFKLTSDIPTDRGDPNYPNSAWINNPVRTDLLGVARPVGASAKPDAGAIERKP